MRLKYGTTWLGDVGWARLAWVTELDRNAAGVGVGLRTRVDASQVGFRVSGQADADTKADAVAAALKQQDQDLALFLDDDTTASFKSVSSADTLSGVRCVRGPAWSDRPGAQHLTWLEFAASWEWETLLPGSAGLLLDFRETLSVAGGAQRLVLFNTLNVGPVVQQTIPATGYRAVQSGQAVGYLAYPTAPNPTWPDALTGEPLVERDSAGRVGANYKGYPVRWRYEFVFAAEPTAFPNQWVG